MVEADLYMPISRWVESPEFSPVRSKNPLLRTSKVAITAGLQWLNDAGDWMRPDLTLVNVSRRKYDSVADLTVHAFEIKGSVRGLTAALFQALSYSRIADYCYLAAPSDAGWTKQIRELGERFGIGLVKFDDATNWHSYRLSVASRMSPDPGLREQFISAAFPNHIDQEDLLRAVGFHQ